MRALHMGRATMPLRDAAAQAFGVIASDPPPLADASYGAVRVSPKRGARRWKRSNLRHAVGASGGRLLRRPFGRLAMTPHPTTLAICSNAITTTVPDIRLQTPAMTVATITNSK